MLELMQISTIQIQNRLKPFKIVYNRDADLLCDQNLKQFHNFTLKNAASLEISKISFIVL